MWCAANNRNEARMENNSQVVAITGAAGGIGSALARRYLRSGAKLALLDMDEAGLSELAEALDGGDRVMTLECDVTSEDGCEDAAAEVMARWAGIDVLVNNAGVSHMNSFAEMDLDVFRRVIDINLFGSVYCTAAFLPSLRHNRGRIAVMSSVAGFAPLSLRSAYATSKHALHGFFDTLRAELVDDGVSVTIVCPSFVKTDIEAHMLGDHDMSTTRQTTGTEADPDDVADVIHDAVTARERMSFPTPDAKMIFDVAISDPAAYDEFMRAMVAGSD